MDRFVLDSFTLLAYLNAEPSAYDVRSLLEAARDHRAILYFSQINLGEIFYLLVRRRGRDKALDTLAALRILPITFCEASEERILAAAEIKARYPISYADAFAAALANEFDAKLVTGDPEFQTLEPAISIQWLTAK